MRSSMSTCATAESSIDCGFSEISIRYVQNPGLRFDFDIVSGDETIRNRPPIDTYSRVLENSHMLIYRLVFRLVSLTPPSSFGGLKRGPHLPRFFFACTAVTGGERPTVACL